MDKVAYAGTVARVVIIAQHRQKLTATDGDLRDKGHEVVRASLRVLADATADVRADGVEVAQQRDRPAVVGGVQILQNPLDEQFGGAVGLVVPPAGMVSRNGEGLALP